MINLQKGKSFQFWEVCSLVNLTACGTSVTYIIMVGTCGRESYIMPLGNKRKLRGIQGLLQRHSSSD